MAPANPCKTSRNHHSTRRTPFALRKFACSALIVLCLQSMLACDATAPMDPAKAHRLTVPADPSFTIAASSVKATAISWSEIDVSWPAINSASGYEVWRSITGATGAYTLLTTTGVSSTSYANVGLSGLTQYCYEVRSFKIAGKNKNYGAFSGAVCATTPAPPVVAPSQVNATPYASTITVAWTDNSADEAGFRIEQATTTAGPWFLAATVGASVTTTNINYIPQDHIVCFRVTAFNSIGPSLPSNADCTALPATPSLLTAKSLDQQTITLTWTDNSAVEDGYKVSRLQSGGDWVDIATVRANLTTYVDATAAANTSYTYRVLAVKDGGYSLPSNQVVAVIATTSPAAPANASVVIQPHCTFVDGCFGGLVDLGWEDLSTNEEGFRVEYSVDGVNDWSLWLQTGPNVTTIEQGPTVTYGCFRVIAFNAAGSSIPSNVACGDASTY